MTRCSMELCTVWSPDFEVEKEVGHDCHLLGCNTSLATHIKLTNSVVSEVHQPVYLMKSFTYLSFILFEEDVA